MVNNELVFLVNIEVPGLLPQAALQEFAMDIESGLKAKAQEIVKPWDGKVELTAIKDRGGHGRRFLINKEEATTAARNYIVDNDVMENKGCVAMSPEERTLLRKAIQTREDIIARQKEWIEKLTYQDF